jgi:hypothetical protein
VYIVYASMFLAIWFSKSYIKRQVLGCWLRAEVFGLILILVEVLVLARVVWLTITYVNCARPEGGSKAGQGQGQGGKQSRSR